jgi:hypothetical protein
VGGSVKVPYTRRPKRNVAHDSTRLGFESCDAAGKEAGHVRLASRRCYATPTDCDTTLAPDLTT